MVKTVGDQARLVNAFGPATSDLFPQLAEPLPDRTGETLAAEKAAADKAKLEKGKPEKGDKAKPERAEKAEKK